MSEVGRDGQDQDTLETQRTIALGLDARAFMGSDLGRYIQRRANDEIDAAKTALLNIDPLDTEAIRALQNHAAVAASVLNWMGDAVTNGENAERAAIEAEG